MFNWCARVANSNSHAREAAGEAWIERAEPEVSAVATPYQKITELLAPQRLTVQVFHTIGCRRSLLREPRRPSSPGKRPLSPNPTRSRRPRPKRGH